MNATRFAPALDLPVILERLTPEEITWLALKSAQAGKSTAEIAKGLLSDAARIAGFGGGSDKSVNPSKPTC
ncbi:MAG: hypothetical protein WCK77_20490 [Verrucomicrobiota bacterium]